MLLILYKSVKIMADSVLLIPHDDRSGEKGGISDDFSFNNNVANSNVYIRMGQFPVNYSPWHIKWYTVLKPEISNIWLLNMIKYKVVSYGFYF